MKTIFSHFRLIRGEEKEQVFDDDHHDAKHVLTSEENDVVLLDAWHFSY
jgi:hypothetical protein